MRWGAISFDGTAIQFSEIARATAGAAPLLAVFDRPSSREGPVGVTATAELVHLNDERREPISFNWNRVPCAIRAVSKDGLRVLFGESKKFSKVPPDRLLLDFGTHGGTEEGIRILSGENQKSNKVPSNQLLLDLGTYSATMVHGEPKAIVECLGAVAKPRNLRRRFQGIALDRQGNLTLVSRKGSLFPIRLTPQGNLIWIPREPAASRPLGTLQRFEKMDEHSVGGRSMFVARWQDDSTAVLDWLGLLHLRSSDRTIPECTIVLCDGPTSGWLSDGRCWGELYFVENKTTTPEKVIWEDVLERFVQRVR
jgi:hypothetical protein